MLANDPVTQARIDLTTALRAAARHGLNEGVCNHFSMTVPGREDLFLVNPQGLHWSEITPSDIVMADGDGNVIEGKYEVEPTAFYIHARIHAGNPRAKVVLHTHMPYATALTSIQDGRIEMCTQNAFRYWDRIAYDEKYGGVALSGNRLYVSDANGVLWALDTNGGNTVWKQEGLLHRYLSTPAVVGDYVVVGAAP